MTDWDRPARLIRKLQERVRNLEAREQTEGVVQEVTTIFDSSADDDQIDVETPATQTDTSADDDQIDVASLTSETARYNAGRYNLDRYE